jgi:ABC-type dipeptide/oligopeptide/nickel transport system permease component
VSENYFELSKHPYFWTAAGLLIFSLGTLVVLGMNQFIRINNLTIVNKALYRTIMPVLNVILYSSYSYAFYLCARMKKSYSPL